MATADTPSAFHAVDRLWLPALAAGLVVLGGVVRLTCLDGNGLTAGEAALPWCYSDIVAIAQSRGLGQGVVPYVDVVTEYPPLTALQWWVGGAIGGGVTGFLAVTTAFQAAAAGATVRLLAGVATPRRHLVLVAAAPTLVATGTVNWDLVAVALLTAGIIAARRGRDVAAGIWFGLGILAKVFPLLAAVAVAWVRWRRGRRRSAGVVVGWTVLVVVVVQVPVALWTEGWDAWLVLSRERPVDWDTVWYGLQALLGRGLPAGLADVLVAAALAAGWLVLLARWRPTSGMPVEGEARREAAALALALVGWLLLAGKVYSPQYTLWLLPLLALSRVPVGMGWALLVADLAVVAIRFPFLAGQQGLTPSAPYGWFAAALAVRWVLLLAVVALAGHRVAPARAAPASG